MVGELGVDPPLRSLLVADFGQIVAGAAVGQTLALLGADVIKVEPVGGEPARRQGKTGRPFIREFNRGKRSLAVDLRDPRGRAVAYALIKKADVLVANMRPGAMDRLGLGYADVELHNPRIIYASVNGFGTTGQAAERPGFDTSAQAESGLMSITGSHDGPPQRVGSSVIDVAAAHVTVQAILAALYRRERTGKGDRVDCSLLGTAIALQGVTWAEYFQTAQTPVRGEPKSVPPPAADVFATLDGEIVLSAHLHDHWVNLCRSLGRADLLEDGRFVDGPARIAHRDEVLQLIQGEVALWSTAALMEQLVSYGIVAGQIRDYDQVRASDAAADIGIWGRAENEDGTSYDALNLPYSIASWPSPNLSTVDEAGGHSREILQDLGHTSEEVGRLIADGVVGSPQSSPTS